ncbi:hypothetical protein SK128_010380 [Halocaridina rubra]|uniref:Uncharacterized protein n=1 Tax=Halocaridina rubra TaxID=373956 RepID=A0AAN8WKI1_HALRR
MLCGRLLLASLAISWLAFADATFLFGAGLPQFAVLSGLAALKGLYLTGEKTLLSAVQQLDPNGCIQKLLCRLQFKEEANRTHEENALVKMFSKGAETITSYNAAFVYASAIGSTSADPKVCDKYFSKCPVSNEELGKLLQQSWGCANIDS